MGDQNSLTAGIIDQIYAKKFMHFSLKIAYYSSSTLAQRFYPRTLRYFRPKDIHSISLACELQHGDMHTWKCRRSHRAIPKAWCSDDTFLSPSLSVSLGSEASLRSSIRESVSRFRDVALCDVGRTTRPSSRGRGYSVATVVFSLNIDNDTNFSAATDNAPNFLLGNCFKKK